MKENFYIDTKVRDYFQNNVKQIFIYITNYCQLNCAHCLYKKSLKKNHEFDYSDLVRQIKLFRAYGAFKITLLGGEPTLYDQNNNNNNLFRLIKCAKDIGYSYIRIDTNGQFDTTLLNNEYLKLLDEITFSLDGYNPDFNDKLRGRNVFVKCVNNIQRAIDLGYNVHITSCVHRDCLSIDSFEYIDKMIELATQLNVNTINFHPVVKVGAPRDCWIGNSDISPDQWLPIYNYLKMNISNNIYKINVRAPERFVSANDLKSNISYYDYCPVKMAERALIDCDGFIRVCAFWIGTNVGIAKHSSNRIDWLHFNNELSMTEKCVHRVCSSQSKKFDELMPLCMSFKPNQNEVVWNMLRNDIKLIQHYDKFRVY